MWTIQSALEVTDVARQGRTPLLAFVSAVIALVASFAAAAAPIPLFNTYRADDGFRLTLNNAVILQADPPTAVVAAVDLGFGLEHVEAMACAGQPFFASAAAAANWLVTHPGGRIYQVAAYLAQTHRLVAALETRPKFVL